MKKIQNQQMLFTILIIIILSVLSMKNVSAGHKDLPGNGDADWNNFTDLSGQFSITASNNTKNGYVGACGSAQVTIRVPSYASITTWVGGNSVTKKYTLMNFQYGQTNTRSNTVTKTLNGTYPRITFSAKYQSGNKVMTLIHGGVITYKEDGTPPSLISNGDNACYRVGQNVSHTWTCRDSQSGCKNGTVTGWGTGSISVAAEDNTCNTRTASFTPNRDGIGPSNWYSYVTPTTWTRTATICGRSISDVGCAGNGADRCTYATSNGNHQVCAQDRVGNLSCGYINVTNIDREPPSCGALTKPDANYWYRTNFNVSSGCDDNGKSGCSRNPFTESKNTPSGSITISDILGNARGCPYDGVKVDVSKPSTSISYGPAYTQMNDKLHSSDKEVEVIINASDTQAGVDRVCYRLDGATSKGDTCVNGSSTKIYIAKEGNTTVTAWSYDKARDYNAGNNSGNYNNSTGGNRSDNASKVVYIDRTAPAISFASTNDGKKWSNKATPVTVTLKDNGSGVKYYDYYWSTSDNDLYDTTSALTRDSAGNIVHTDISSSWVSNRSFIETNPTNMAHNDVIYLHVRACDRSFYTNNCSTATYKTGIHFDNLKPMAPDADKLSQEWVNKFKLTFNVNEHVQTGKQNSGLNTISTFWDENEKHKEENMTRENSKYASKANVTNSNPANKYNPRYSWTLDFRDLNHMLTDGTQLSVGACEEGSRFMKVNVSDIAGNVSEMLVIGPYKWDTTIPFTQLIGIDGDERTFLPAEVQK